MIRAAANRGLRVLITGAADGVGLASAYVFSRRGAELILCDRNGTALTRAGNAVGGLSRCCDVVSEQSVAIFAAEIDAKFDSFDVLINAAGSGYVRTLGMVHMSRALLPILHRGSGHRLIINIAPAGGISATGLFPYASSHESFKELSDAIADQTRGSMIGVVSMAPEMRQASAAAERSFYRIERVNEAATADRIFDLVASARPDWQPDEARPQRRA
jgi:NADP-dependent 3-hydroxy acid dehydrogenase YdfG